MSRSRPPSRKRPCRPRQPNPYQSNCPRATVYPDGRVTLSGLTARAAGDLLTLSLRHFDKAQLEQIAKRDFLLRLAEEYRQLGKAELASRIEAEYRSMDGSIRNNLRIAKALTESLIQALVRHNRIYSGGTTLRGPNHDRDCNEMR